MLSRSNALDMKGRSVFITGGTSLIGAEIVWEFARAGADVIFTYNENDEKAARMIEKAGREALRLDAVSLDQCDTGSCRTVVAAAAQKLGKIDILINNSGAHGHTSAMELCESDWDTLMKLNLRGTFFLTQEVARHMISTGSGGAIVSISSINSVVPLQNALHYGVSKAGIDHMTRHLAVELGRYGIRVNAVAPGLIDSPMLEIYCPGWKKRYIDRAPLGRPGTPSDIAGICLFLASPLASWITGQIVTADGGVTLAPAY